MDYFTTPSHRQLRATVREFAEKEVRPHVPRLEAERTIEHEIARKIARQGWIGVTIPRAYGGMGMGHLAKTIIIEELARVSGAMGAMVQASQLGVAKVIHFGNEEQRSHWLPRFASGESLPTIAVTEPESGGHVLGMSGTAVRDGDEYVLNGRKWFVGNSHIGDVHGVVFRTGEGSRGLSAFLVESDRPGFRCGDPGSQAGLHGFSFGEIIFEDCRIPVSNRLGEEGSGLAVAYSSSTLYGRLNLAAVSLGIHQATVEDTARFASERVLYGKPIAELPTINLKLGEMQSRLMTARLAAYHASHMLDQGMTCDAELMNAKLINTELAIDSARNALEIFAARGLQAEYNVERYLRDAVHIHPPAGTSDVQRLRLGQFAVGATKGQWSQKLSAKVRIQDEDRELVAVG
ncbi:acyl-CoA dehydrogenase family protein [Allostreptomyces psammosilenae]|uniref:Alkylation response protein AidB-like acyl-CoA dehydrogenase n=1 Tax=Allostreptomyces psammosilenae TaxID=1892865 RepID=A0A852ZRI0_9ACTN|nr:acyl-CoA dehydrogenase family protein [Allostreptomyces psammosilenae]NYI05056.1 alkylation response protein AidB-like acyl-CoA dehydrogenase [Allostreptomyces psammosilenae]